MWVPRGGQRGRRKLRMHPRARGMESRRAKPPEPAGGHGSVIRAGCLVLTPSIGRCCNRHCNQPNYSRHFSWVAETRSCELQIARRGIIPFLSSSFIYPLLSFCWDSRYLNNRREASTGRRRAPMFAKCVTQVEKEGRVEA